MLVIQVINICYKVDLSIGVLRDTARAPKPTMQYHAIPYRLTDRAVLQFLQCFQAIATQ